MATTLVGGPASPARPVDHRERAALRRGQASVWAPAGPVDDLGFVDVRDWNAVIRDGVSAAGDGRRSRPDQPVSFWRVYFAAGFSLIGGVALAMGSYLLTVPQGAHFSLQVAIVGSFVVLSGLGISLSTWLSSRAWRAGFLLFVTSACCVGIATAAYLGTGLDSPLLFTIVLPILYAAQALGPSAVALCSGVASTAVAVLALSDPHIVQAYQDHLAMVATLFLGCIAIAMISAMIRVGLQTDQRTLIWSLRQRAEVDELTGCANYRAFYDLLGKEIRQANRDHCPVAMMICDVDLLKSFNDAHGHAAGDAALGALGMRLLATARTTDLVGRVGGDEFALLMPNTTAAQATVLADRILTDPDPTAPLAVSVSIGVAQLDPNHPNATRLIRDADTALYDAKARGRHTVVVAGAQRPEPAEGDAPEDQGGTHDADQKLMASAVRRARRESTESRTILDTLINDAPIGFCFIDRDFRVAFSNPAMAALSGMSVHDQVGRAVAEVVPELWPSLEPLHHRLLEEQKPILDIELRGPSTQHPDEEHDWLGSCYPVHLDGDVIGFGVFAADITDRKRLERGQRDLTDSVVRAMAVTSEARDPYTAGHQQRVAGIAAAIATELGHDEQTVHGIELAATIHDIGKVAIPGEILSRPGRISDEEMALIRTHTTAGYKIVRDIDFPWPIAQMILQHHERMDGSGYPQHLHGDQIQIGARIIAVADTLEAMAAHRPYRAALGLDRAFATLAEGRGRLYDTAVVDACLHLFRDGPLTVEINRYLRGEQEHLDHTPRHDPPSSGPPA